MSAWPPIATQEQTFRDRRFGPLTQRCFPSSPGFHPKADTMSLIVLRATRIRAGAASGRSGGLTCVVIGYFELARRSLQSACPATMRLRVIDAPASRCTLHRASATGFRGHRKRIRAERFSTIRRGRARLARSILSRRPPRPVTQGARHGRITQNSSRRCKVVLVDSWTYGCYNCVNTLPYVTKLYDTYRRRHPYPGISVRTVGRQCAGRAEAAWHHLSGGAGQRLGDLERLAQSILRRPNTSLTSTVPLLA